MMKVFKLLLLSFGIFITLDLFAQSVIGLDDKLIEAEAKHLGMSKEAFIKIIQENALKSSSRKSSLRLDAENVSNEQPLAAVPERFLSDIEDTANSGCYNLDFENKANHFEGWYGDAATGIYRAKGYCYSNPTGAPYPIPQPSFDQPWNLKTGLPEPTYFRDFTNTFGHINQRFQVMSNKAQLDPYLQQCVDLNIYTPEQAKAINLPTVAKGSDFSIKLGNNFNGYEQDMLMQVFNVSERYYSYNTAVVFDHPTKGHDSCSQPYFMVRLYSYDQLKYVECADYVIRSGQASKGLIYPIEINGDTTFKYPSIIKDSTGFQYSYENPQINRVDALAFRPWQTNTIDFQKVLGDKFIGRKVRIEFTVSDCSATGHFGYAYVDGACLKSNISTNGMLCKNNNLRFFSNSTGSFDGESYSWSFGDGKTSPEEKPCHTYASPGTYNVKLELTLPPSANSCTEKLVFNHVVVITDQCVTKPIDLTINGDCLGSPTLLSTPSDDKYQSGTYAWEFGDGTVSADRAPCHTFPASPMEFLVKLRISPPINTCMNGDANALSEIFEGSQNITIKNCSAPLSALGQCSNSPIALKSSTNSIGPWNVIKVEENGAETSIASETATMLCKTFEPGSYRATFGSGGTTTTNNGCPGSTTLPPSQVTFIVKDCPRPVITYQGELCTGATISLQSSNTEPYSSLTPRWNIAWQRQIDWDPEKLNKFSFCQKFENAGEYKLNLSFQLENNGCEGSDALVTAEEKIMTIKDCPPPIIVSPAVCLGKVSQFSLVPTQTATTYVWKFGDGTEYNSNSGVNGQNPNGPTHTYEKAGSYPITVDLSFASQNTCNVPREVKGITGKHNVENCDPKCAIFKPEPGKKYLVSGWASEERMVEEATPILNYSHAKLIVTFMTIDDNVVEKFEFATSPNTPIIDGWQKIEGVLTAPKVFSKVSIQLAPSLTD
ncbi:MAG TPA: PKD domain-containing protein, partial [Cytophagaceae bacterium]